MLHRIQDRVWIYALHFAMVLCLLANPAGADCLFLILETTGILILEITGIKSHCESIILSIFLTQITVVYLQITVRLRQLYELAIWKASTSAKYVAWWYLIVMNSPSQHVTHSLMLKALLLYLCFELVHVSVVSWLPFLSTRIILFNDVCILSDFFPSIHYI